MAHCNLRTLLVLTLALLIVVSGTLSVFPPLTVHACNACNFLLKWGSSGSGNGQFNGPQGVFVDSSGNVYVTDRDNDRVEKFTNTGSYLAQWGSSGSGNGQFNGPVGVAVDSFGYVYVTDFGNNRVEKFTGTGTYLSQLGCATGLCSAGSGPGQFKNPFGVAVDSARNVYVVDGTNDRVEKFTSTGTYVTQWGSPGSGNGRFNYPRGVAVDSSGNVYVADLNNNRVEKFTSTGVYLAQWSGSGFNQLNGPVGVAVDSSANVYVTDFGNNRVEKFTSTGGFISAWGSTGSLSGQFNGPVGVAVDGSGNVYVTDFSNHRVELFSDATNFVNVSLVAGWSLISLPLVPQNPGIIRVLAGLIAANNLTVVWSYQGGVWRSFTPPSTGSLTTMADGLGYWIYVTHPSTLSVLGYVIPPASTPPAYSLSLGWNLVGFKPQPDPALSVSVSTYLTSISGKYDAGNVWVYNNGGGSWIRMQPTDTLSPGQAVWVLMTAPATLRP